MSKKDDKNNFKDLTAQELAAKGRDLRHEMFNLRLQQASAQLEKPARIRAPTAPTAPKATKEAKAPKASKPAKATKTAAAKA
jgi:ribosomal protein L29